MADYLPLGFGGRPDIPDLRDYYQTHPTVQSLLQRLRRPAFSRPPRHVTRLSRFFGSIRDQLHLQSGTAFACVALLEYFQRRTQSDRTPLAPRFVYKAGRVNAGLSGDAGLGLRDALKAIARFGVPPERYCPYRVDAFDNDVPALAVGYSRNFPRILYFHPAEDEQNGVVSLATLKQYLAAGLPLAFSVGIPDSIDERGFIDFRPGISSMLGVQSLVAVGYDDDYRGPARRTVSPAGAILFRGSWGTAFGEEGHGWLPYEFVVRGLATDFWAVLSPAWVDCERLSNPLGFTGAKL